jgi:hypothetical protein
VTERTQLTLYFVLATFVVVVFIAAFLIRRHDRTEKAITGVRDRIDGLDQATGLEHDKMAQQLKKVEGRTQFLVATTIAEELGAQRASEDTPTQGDDAHD